MDTTELAHRGADAWNRNDLDAYVALYSDDCEIITPDTSGKGHDAVRAFWASNSGPFPEARITLRRVVADGADLVEEGVFEGTNTGPVPMPDGTELPPTGAAVSVPFMNWHTVRDGRITSSRMLWDNMGFLQQLGLLQE